MTQTSNTAIVESDAYDIETHNVPGNTINIAPMTRIASNSLINEFENITQRVWLHRNIFDTCELLGVKLIAVKVEHDGERVPGNYPKLLNEIVNILRRWV